jgi:IclR family KDG regulon transcriptional repressor
MLPPIKSARRTFEVLEHFQLRRMPLTLNEICAALAYPASSASALLKSLVALGYLEYNKSGRTYMPTMKIADLGGWVQGAIFGDGRILDAMNGLSARFGETVTLTVQSDLYAQYLYLIQSRLPIWYPIPIGTLRPLTGSGSGLMMLARQRDADIRKIVKRIQFHRLDTRAPTLADVMGHVRACREQGYIFSKHLIEKGAGGISMLLADPRLGRSYALGVHGPVERLEPRQGEIVEALAAAVAAPPPTP